MDEFYRTRMGQEFFLRTMPGIAEQLERLNGNLEALVAMLRRSTTEAGTPPEPREGS